MDELSKEKEEDILVLPIPEDQSHWKCADFVDNNVVLVDDIVKKEKKTKKILSTKR